MNRLMISGVVALLVGVVPATAALAQQQYPPAQSQTPSVPPPGPSTQSQGGQPGVETGLAIASDALIGSKVKNQQGQDIGEVSKLLIDPRQGKITSLIIKQGGTLGVGGKEMSLPWDAVKVQQGQDQQLVVTAQQPILEPAPSAQQPREEPQPAASPPDGGNRR